MGTRNLTCVVSNERYKVANYGQWDGYPSGLGISLLKFLNEDIDLNKFKEKVENVVLLKAMKYQSFMKNVAQNRAHSL